MADVGGLHVNEWLVCEKYVVKYDGGTKKVPESWLNIQIIIASYPFHINATNMILRSPLYLTFEYRKHHFLHNIREQHAEFVAMCCVEYLETNGVLFEYPTQNTYIEQ